MIFRNKLEGSVDQWTEYDNKYEGLSQWIKDMEGKVRNEGNLKSDLPGKTQQAEHFSVCIIENEEMFKLHNRIVHKFTMNKIVCNDSNSEQNIFDVRCAKNDQHTFYDQEIDIQTHFIDSKFIVRHIYTILTIISFRT